MRSFTRILRSSAIWSSVSRGCRGLWRELQPEHVEHCRLRHFAQFRSPGDPRLGIGDLSRWPHAARTRRDCDVLLAVYRIGHGRRVDARADIDPPQHIQRLVIEGDDRTVEQRRHHDPTGGREYTGRIGIGQLDALPDIPRPRDENPERARDPFAPAASATAEPAFYVRADVD